MEFITYERFGARGDGITDDIDAIIAAHEYANEHNLPVRTTADAHYYIGGGAKTAVIMTDTDWGTSCFTIDDRAVEDNQLPVFRVVSRHQPVKLNIPALRRGQKNAGIVPGIDCYVVVTERDIRRFIRRGLNQNNGTDQTDNFELKADGTIMHELLWDFPHIDETCAYPIDSETLHLRGGFFITIANQDPSTYDYYGRNLSIERSNTEISDLSYFVEGEGETGAPYRGFLSILHCARVTVRSCFFTPHKTYWTIGAANLPVPMGSYSINIGSATDVLFKDCRQKDILDRSKWGLVGSNFCKNIELDGCIFSRMDAHQGVYNYTIRNSTLGHQGINAIGDGLLTVENCVLYGYNIVGFRADYGSIWSGDMVVKNVVWHPACGDTISPCLFGAHNDGQHNFGYECSLPRHITLENIHVDDSSVPEDYEGPCIFNDYHRFGELGDHAPNTSSADPYPYLPCKKMTITNLTFASGKKWKLCENPLLTPVEELIEN